MTGRMHSLRRLTTAAMCSLLLLVLAPCGSVWSASSGAVEGHAAGVKAVAPTVAIGQRVHVAPPASHVVADADRYRLHSVSVQWGSVATEAYHLPVLRTSTSRPRAPPVS